MKIIRVKNSLEGGAIASGMIIDLIKEKESATLGLATGSSPETTYAHLVEAYKAGEVSFTEVNTVNLDEYVGLDGSHPQSYRYFMNEKLFSKIDVKRENTYLPNGIAEDLTAECERYNRLIITLVPVDIQLLGIGHNGHIGFNEPSDFFADNTHVVNLSPSTIEANSRFFPTENDVPKQAITMGISQIMSAKSIILLAFGEEKSKILHAALTGEITPHIPASILQKHKNLTVIADESALVKMQQCF
jgi:glucosamine-6-phosphate deaminase